MNKTKLIISLSCGIMLLLAGFTNNSFAQSETLSTSDNDQTLNSDNNTVQDNSADTPNNTNPNDNQSTDSSASPESGYDGNISQDIYSSDDEQD
jgi:hypothetical protein